MNVLDHKMSENAYISSLMAVTNRVLGVGLG